MSSSQSQIIIIQILVVVEMKAIGKMTKVTPYKTRKGSLKLSGVGANSASISDEAITD